MHAPRIAPHVTFANAASALALFVALGGTAYATIELPKNSVGPAQLQKDAITSRNIKDGTLKAIDFKRRLLPRGPIGPRGPAGPPGVVDTSQFYSKTQADARYLRGTLTVVATGTINGSGFGSATATCPTGYQAIGGGVEPENVAQMYVSSSQPIIDSKVLGGLTDGQHAPATAWRADVVDTTGPSARKVKVVAICAPIG